MKVLKVLLKIVKNKYLITLVVFATWLLFFDKNDLFTQIDLTRQVKKMKEDTLYYSHEIQMNKKNFLGLQKDSADLEKFARENYLMKRDSEDIYIFVEQ